MLSGRLQDYNDLPANVIYMTEKSPQIKILFLLELFLLERINLNPRMDQKFHPLWSVGWNYIRFQSNGFISHYLMNAITDPYWDWNQPVLMKGVRAIFQFKGIIIKYDNGL